MSWLIMLRIRIRNRLFSECTGNAVIIGIIYIYIYICVYICTHIHIQLHIHIHIYILYAMYSNRLFRAPVICAARDPTAKSRGSREPRDQACMLIVSPRNLTGNSAELLPRYLSNLRAIGRKSKVPISQPRDPTKSRGGQPPAQQKKAQTYFVWRCLLRLICR